MYMYAMTEIFSLKTYLFQFERLWSKLILTTYIIWFKSLSIPLPGTRDI